MSEALATRPKTILEDIQQTKPFRTKSQEALVSLIRSTDDAKRHMAALLEPYDITVQQYNVLRILRGAGDKGLPTLQIGERMLERTPGVTRLIDRMEKKGWVSRNRCVQDRRRVWCCITEEGSELLTTLDPVVNEGDNRLSEVLDDTELERFIDYLDRIRTLFND